MIDKLQRPGQVANRTAAAAGKKQTGASNGAFGAMLQQRIDESKNTQTTQGINFSKHALARAEQRGIELTPTLMDKLAGSVEKAQEKGANNILAFDTQQAFVINVPYGRVITMMTQDEMKENIFTNIDGAVLL